MTKLKHTFKTDILFKLLFRKHQELLKHLVAHLLRIPLESITQFTIENPDIPPESMGKKFCRLDIHMTVDGQQVNLEIQVEDEGDFPERTLYHWARLYSSSLPAGEKYHELPRTIVISIINFLLFKGCKEFHSEFQALEVKRNDCLTDKMVLHFFELKKLPNNISKDDLLLLWLALFNANTEDDLKQIENLGVPEMSEAITAYNSLTVSEELKELERMRVKASHDEAQAVYNAEKREQAKIAKNLKNAGFLSNIQIAEATGLAIDEIEVL